MCLRSWVCCVFCIRSYVAEFPTRPALHDEECCFYPRKWDTSKTHLGSWARTVFMPGIYTAVGSIVEWLVVAYHKSQQVMKGTGLYVTNIFRTNNASMYLVMIICLIIRDNCILLNVGWNVSWCFMSFEINTCPYLGSFNLQDNCICTVPLGQSASCQIRKIAGCACAGNAGNVFPATTG